MKTTVLVTLLQDILRESPIQRERIQELILQVQTDPPEGTELEKAHHAWANWYSARLDRINKQLKNKEPHEDYTGYEQDLFEALGSPGVEE